MVGILDDLTEGDRFNIITFNSGIEKYQKEMTAVNENSIRKAQGFIREKVRAYGGKLYIWWSSMFNNCLRANQ